ncbi:proton-coupled folate transporter [Plakobranchus ocellatus]|uniref:Proton-coupled folate transporter n=1 Tax=Plakobranchus ocellatus TaxID=259542 RepID=A0AAV4BAK2_9GAST|nr:proton-coupled folate transporter [Plakobranchus ocellatus]
MSTDDDSKDDPSTPLLRGHNSRRAKERRKFPFLRARILAIIVPTFVGSALSSRESLMAQYLVARIGGDRNVTHKHVNPCHSDTNSSAVREANDVQAEAADLLSHYALIQVIPAFFACLVFGSYSDFLGRRVLLLVPIFTTLVKVILTSLIIGYHLSLNYFYLAYGVDGLSGSWFTILIAIYSLTADINAKEKSRTLSIFAMMCISSVTQAGVSIAMSDLIDSLGFFDASLLITAISAVAFLLPLVSLPETLHCHQLEITNSIPPSQEYENEISHNPKPDLPEAASKSTAQKWINPAHQLHRIFGFYISYGTIRHRLEMVILMLIFMFPAANEINLSAIDALYQLNRPFCWGPREIGYYSAIRSGGSNVVGGIWMAILQKCLPFEALGLLGVLAQAVGLGFEGLIKISWQFYLVPAILAPAVGISAIVRGMMSIKARPDQQGALFSSIAVMECLTTLASTTSYNKVYSATVDLSMPGAVYLLMAACALTAVILYLLYFVIREKPDLTTVAEIAPSIQENG